MATKRSLDRIGGVGCLLISVVCWWLAYNDWSRGISLWKVWVGMSVILIVNGIAMLRYAQRGAGGNKLRSSPPQSRVVR
jgi:hypothetical protein